MKFILIFIISIAPVFAFAQFAVIYDKDSICNIRSSAGKGDNIIDKLKNGHLVYCYPEKTSWVSIDYTKKNEEISGRVYKDRLIYISGYSKIPVLKKEDSRISLKKDSITVVVTQQPFDKSKHTFTPYKEAADQVELIDNKKYWGKDGGIPTTEYRSIEVNIGKRKILLPATAFENLYEPSLGNTQVNYDSRNDIIYIRSMNGDGAGGYEVVWKIEHGIYREKLVVASFDR